MLASVSHSTWQSPRLRALFRMSIAGRVVLRALKRPDVALLSLSLPTHAICAQSLRTFALFLCLHDGNNGFALVISTGPPVGGGGGKRGSGEAGAAVFAVLRREPRPPWAFERAARRARTLAHAERRHRFVPATRLAARPWETLGWVALRAYGRARAIVRRFNHFHIRLCT